MFQILRNLTLICSAFAATTSAQTDILIADFESEDYGEWTASGEAFGPGPARGTLPAQMQVSGYRGSGLVNSFFGGDGTTGTLSSPPFEVERRYLVFLVGGGGYEGTTCVNLLLDGAVVRTATGPNTEPGGSEELAAFAWDLKDLAGKSVQIQIVDARTGSWGHINVDHIVLTDRKPDIPERPGRQTRELRLTERYLLFPIRTGARKSRVDLRIEDRDVRQFDAELARTKEEVDFWSFLDIGAFRGQLATIALSAATEESAALIVQSNELPAAPDLYDEPLRPQLRFSQRLGWNNDPNGMVFHDGEWHLYFQHNPYGWRWGNMHWGHAVSRDLVHWEQLPIAIYNRRHGDWAFSGGAVVDEANTAGWQSGEEPVIVASWTSTGRGECLAYSNDRGRSFTEYAGNPVVKHSGRDPKIIWYAPGEHWVMAVYSQRGEERAIAFHSSKDLKSWKLESHLAGYYECPEIFELPVDGNAADARWVVFAADARYALGAFDGKVFTPLHEGKHRLHHGNYYASQTFSNTPDGRRIQMGWARIEMPGMPFNQTFSFPHELTLRTTADGVRMFAEPVTEIEALHRRKHTLERAILAPEQPVDLPVTGELFDVRARFVLGGADAVGLDIGGNRIVYDARAGKLQGAELDPVDGAVSIRVLVDRPMLEIIGNRGRVYITSPRPERGELTSIRAFAEGGTAEGIRLEVHELESVWPARTSGDVLPLELPELRAPLASEAASRIYTLASRQARYLRTTIRTWEEDSLCKLLTESRSGEHWVRPNASALEGFAFLHRFGPYDAEVVGCERSELLSETIVPMMRYLVSTHITGSRPTDDGKPWGNAWQSAHWAYSLGRAGWYLWGVLPAELRDGVRRVVGYEAERFVARRPPHQVRNDTKAEENAWNCTILSAAAILMPGDERRPAWEAAFQRWALSAFLRPADERSERRVDDRTLAEQFSGANIHDDFTLENHGMVHPDYMSTFSLSMGCIPDFLLTGREPPEALQHNAAGLYENLKWFTLPDGGFFYPMGQDWRLFRNPDWLFTHALMAVFGGDPDAWSLALACLDCAERMQARPHGGAIYAPGEYFFASTQHSILRSLTRTWLALHLAESIVDRGAPRRGVRHLAEGKILLNRGANAIHGVAWGAEIMAQCVPLRPDRIVSPEPRSGVGAIHLEGAKRALPISLHSVEIQSDSDRFQVDLVVDHGDAVRARLSFQSNPDGSLRVREELRALRAIRTARIATGLVGILNNASWIHEKGRRTLTWDSGTASITSGSGEELDIAGTRHLAIYGVLHITSEAPLHAHYVGARDPERARITDRLYLQWLDGPRTWESGAILARYDIVQRID